jgi:signal transduction histidine kinase
MLAHPDRSFDPGPSANIATVFTVLVAYISAAIAVGGRLGLLTWAILILLGVILLVMAIPLEGFFFKSNKPVKVAAFFGILLILCGAINYLGQAQFWLLYLPFASAAASVLSRKALAVFCLVVLVLFCLPLGFQDPSLLAQWVLIFLCALVFVLIFTEVSVRDQQARREVERLARELEDANQRLREYTAQAEELARSRERNRLAREIHDSLGHYLTVVNIQLEAAKALVENHGWKEEAPDLFAALDKAQDLTRNGLADVRKSVAALRAGPMDDLPFLDALKNLVAECQEAGLVSHLKLENKARALSPHTELALYRTAQEALTNVRKHARASRVDVSLAFTPDTVRLEIRDNGVGMEPGAESNDTFGLLGIRERAEILHGTVALQSAPGEGLRLVLEIPLTK